MNIPLRGYLQSIIEIPRIKKIAAIPKNSHLLEIGCGNGRGTQLIQKHFQPAKVTAIDLDHKMINLARQKHYVGKAEFHVADVTNLPFKNCTFDAVIDFGVIHHVPYWKKAVEQIIRVVKPGGLLVLEDLSIETFNSPVGKLIRKLFAHPYERMYKQADFVKYLKRCGIEVLIEKTYTNFGLIRYFTVVTRKS